LRKPVVPAKAGTHTPGMRWFVESLSSKRSDAGLVISLLLRSMGPRFRGADCVE